MAVVLQGEVAAVREREEAVQAKIRAADEALLQAQRQADDAQSELFDLRSKFDEAMAAHSCERDMLSMEMERLQTDLNLARKDAEAARSSARRGQSSEVEEEHSKALSILQARVSESEEEVVRQSQTIATLTQELREWQDTLEQHKGVHRKAIDAMQVELTARTTELTECKKELAVRPAVEDVSRLRQQLSLLQTLYFNADDAESPSTTPSGTPVTADGQEGLGGVHDVVMKRVRQLESGVTKAKRTIVDLEAQLEARQAELRTCQQTLSDQKQLIARLEQEVQLGTAAGAGMAARAVPSGSLLQPHLSHDTQLLAAVGGASLHASQALAGSHAMDTGDMGLSSSERRVPQDAGDTADATSLVGILRSQRDRYKAQMAELEMAASARTRELDDVRAKMEKLMEDNVKLYEKIKFLESYPLVAGSLGQGSDSVPSSTGPLGSSGHDPFLADWERKHGKAGPGGAGAGAGAGGRTGRPTDDVENQYRRIYEDRVNPFADFNRREKQKRYSNLSAAEKITLNSTKFFISNKIARTFVFFYAVGLHCLVFATLYHFSNVSHAHHC